jgi:metallophosphoesterase (TIGR00282 family)
VRLLLIGDIVGKPGRRIIIDRLGAIRQEHRLDFVIANAENAADGSGLTPPIYRELIGAGIDCITLGDHAYRRREIFNILETERNIVRPGNYPDTAPGRDYTLLEVAPGVQIGIFCLLGRTFMKPVDCPMQAADRIIGKLGGRARLTLLDYHAEATSDMQVMGRYLDGRVNAVLGTHTHVATADECILPGGTAFQCDVGMTGPHESIIGRKIERVVEATRHFKPSNYDVAVDDVRLHGTIVDVDENRGHAKAIQRLVVCASDPV